MLDKVLIICYDGRLKIKRERIKTIITVKYP